VERGRRRRGPLGTRRDVTLRGEKISRITRFIEPGLLPILGLPEHLGDNHSCYARS
jgi:hypothetical protein